jgi:4,5-DOPA dioxygenase extradiol
MNIKDFSNVVSDTSTTEKMPLLFIGHGNPMNAITDNIYSRGWAEMGAKLTPPKAILCISAHWLTSGTAVTMTSAPQTIHDFGGFPDELFRVQYPAPGAVDYAKLAIDNIQSIKVHEDVDRGLDHGAWSVLKNMYPKADIPVFQLSIDYTKPPHYHFNLARELSLLRMKGLMIIASGNVVHNLRMMRFGENQKPYDWAVEFDALVKKSIEENNATPLLEYQKLGELATLAHPTNDHYLPLLYSLGLRDKTDNFQFFNDMFDLGSVSMRSVVFN